MEKYNLHQKVYKDHVHCKIRKDMHGLSQAGEITNNLLKHRLAFFDYSETKYTTGM